jgi:hypothetical protein
MSQEHLSSSVCGPFPQKLVELGALDRMGQGASDIEAPRKATGRLKSDGLKGMTDQTLRQPVPPERLDADHAAAVHRVSELPVLFQGAHTPAFPGELLGSRTAGGTCTNNQNVVVSIHTDET